MTAPRHDDHTAVLEDLTFLADHGVGADEAAHRTGFSSAKSLDKYLRRLGRGDLAVRLAHQNPTALRRAS